MGDVDYVFAFPLMGAIRAFDSDKIAEAIAGTEKATPAGKHQLIFAANHDTNRLASEPGITPEKLRTAAVLTMLLKGTPLIRSEEHTSELQSLMRISYAGFCLKKTN